MHHIDCTAAIREKKLSNRILYFINANINRLKYNSSSFTYFNNSYNTASAALVTQDSLQII